MEPKTNVRTVAEWLELPELSIPRVQTEVQSGAVFTIVKVGFLIASRRDCHEAGVLAPTAMPEKCFLPTAMVGQNGAPSCVVFQSLFPIG